MAYNKSKHVENAQRFLHQGKVPLAIGEYQIILKQEPRDQVTLMTVGDLFVRQGETFQALEYFERLAQIFLADGFITKAIAVYKKIAKLAPEETRPLERLGELYIQQGVLSEARPIYLHLAELHQRAGRQPQAIALLRKLLEAEPDNLRLQTRVAELSMAANQPAEAKAAYLAAAEQSHRHGDHEEAIKYADRALKIEASDATSVTVKARALAAAGQRTKSVALLESLPQVETGGEAARLLIDLYLEANEHARACELAAKIFARNAKNFASAHHVASQLLDAGEPNRALTLLDLIREAMTDAGEHEALSQSLTRATERMPANIEPREWLVALYARISDSFRLPDALASLGEACEAAGKHDRARQVYAELLERSPENEAARRKYESVGKGSDAAVEPAATEPVPEVKEQPETADIPVAAGKAAPKLDDDTQQFITQALTDVDLFSSYGLTQKAVDLLEIVLQRAPDHAATLERLLDLHLGAGDERRTAELAAQLHRIHSDRGDHGAADRFAELNRRFERAATQAPEGAPAEHPASTPEFSVPAAASEATSEAETALEPVLAMASTPVLEPESKSGTEKAGAIESSASGPAVHEVDLSDEWAALSTELTDLPSTKEAESPLASPSELGQSEGDTEAVFAETGETAPEPTMDISEFQDTEEIAAEAEIEVAPSSAPQQSQEEPAGQDAAEVPPEYVMELESVPVAESSANPVPSEPVLNTPLLNADDFLQALSNDLDPEPMDHALSETSPAPVMTSSAPSEMAPVLPNKPLTADKSAGPLGDLFDEFRAELGETAGEEDLETHYNLGIAYREMGLVEEAISEFQKVAKTCSDGQHFRYAMQCYTLLGLAFMEKNQPSIAAMWYERALRTTALDQETVLALRYDLGVAQEMAGDVAAARKSLLEVYGTNIDYRDVAERLASLGKG